MYQYNVFNTTDIKPYSNNSRTHTEEQVLQVAASIEEFGFTNPILVDNKLNIIAGHCRHEAAIRLNMNSVPCIVLEGLSEDQKKAYVIADNRLALNAGWDIDLLKSELFDLDQAEFDLDLLGFTENEIANLLNPDEVLGETDPDEAVTFVDDPISKLGDIWLLGEHRLMCGDSTNFDEVEKLLSGQKPNTMITDPPYGVNYEANLRSNKRIERRSSKGVKTEKEVSSNLNNDDQADWTEVYQNFMGNVAYVWHASAFTDVVMSGLRYAGFEIKQQIIWNKNVHSLSRSDFHWKHEPCWYAIRKDTNRPWFGGRSQMTVWDVPSIIFEKNDKTGHPTQKPVELYKRPIEYHTNPGEYIYEPFGGSGTSIIAAEQTCRRSLTMELDPKYCDMIIKRWQSFTGKKAIHDTNKQTYEELKNGNQE